LEEQVGRILLERYVADLVDDEQCVAAQPGQFGGEAAVLVGGLSRETQSTAVANRTRWPCWAAAMANPMDRCVFPVPGVMATDCNRFVRLCRARFASSRRRIRCSGGCCERPRFGV
jgi:hypothetical protein